MLVCTAIYGWHRFLSIECGSETLRRQFSIVHNLNECRNTNEKKNSWEKEIKSRSIHTLSSGCVGDSSVVDWTVKEEKKNRNWKQIVENRKID